MQPVKEFHWVGYNYDNKMRGLKEYFENKGYYCKGWITHGMIAGAHLLVFKKY